MAPSCTERETVSQRNLKRVWFARRVLSTIGTWKPRYGQFQSLLVFEPGYAPAVAGKATARIFGGAALDQATSTTALVSKMTSDAHPYEYDLVVIGGGSGGLVRFRRHLVVPSVLRQSGSLYCPILRRKLLVCFLLL